MTGLATNRKVILDILGRSQTTHLEECPICGTNRWEYFGGRYHFDLRIEYWICPECALVGQSPRLDDDILPEFYTNFYRHLYMGSAIPTEDDFEFEQKRGENLLDILLTATSNKKVGRILDFGCSTGGLLSIAKSKFNAEFAAGIELDAKYSDFARKHGFSVYSSVEETKKAGADKFDLITMSHVLEHVANIHLTLANLSCLIKENGFICIEVPHSCEGACFQITHLWGFNESALSRLLSDMGFDTIFSTTHGYPRSPHLSNLYLVIIARKSQGDNSIKKNLFSPFRERKKRYLTMQPSVSPVGYQIMLLKNIVKQLLGWHSSLVAYSYWPSKLASWKERSKILDRD